MLGERMSKLSIGERVNDCLSKGALQMAGDQSWVYPNSGPKTAGTCLSSSVTLIRARENGWRTITVLFFCYPSM